MELRKIRSIFRLRPVVLLISMIALCASLWALTVVESQRGQLQRLLSEPVLYPRGILDDGEVDGASSGTQVVSYQQLPLPPG